MKQKIHRRRKVSVRVNLRDMLRLIRVDTLLKVHNYGILVIRLICHSKQSPKQLNSDNVLCVQIITICSRYDF